MEPLNLDLISRQKQFERNTKLQEIFTPHAQRRRNKFFQESGTDSLRFVHYTSADAALKIIKSKRLWMRSSACMSDYQEVQHGFAHLHQSLADPARLSAFKEALDSVVPGAAEKAINDFNHWLRTGTIQFKTFILSISEHKKSEDFHGRLSMWRAFGGNSARVAMVFNVPKTSVGADAMKIFFSPVTYLENNGTDSLIAPVIENVRNELAFLKSLPPQEVANWLFSMLLVNVTCVKHIGFHEEQEWRVVHCPELYPTNLIQSSTETIGGIPQIVCHLPLDKTVDPCLADLEFSTLFDRLIIGPSPYPITMIDAYAGALSQAGVPNARTKVFASGIPIR